MELGMLIGNFGHFGQIFFAKGLHRVHRSYESAQGQSLSRAYKIVEEFIGHREVFYRKIPHINIRGLQACDFRKGVDLWWCAQEGKIRQ